MKRAAIYRKAAKMIEDKQACSSCIALDFAGAGEESRRKYSAVFRPEKPDDPAGIFWWRDCGCHGTRRYRDPRILALCFMAAMVEAGDA